MSQKVLYVVSLGLAALVIIAPLGGVGLVDASIADVGDTPDTAMNIAVDTEYTGYSISEGDQDWFSISLQAGETLNTSLLFTQDVTNPALAIWRDTNNDGTVDLLDYVNTYSDNEALSIVANTTGTYYVQVYAGGGGGASDTYDLVVGTPTNSATTLNLGIEIQQFANVTSGQDVTVSTYVNNRLNRSVSSVDVDLYVDANDDGQFTSNESVATQRVTLPGETVSTANLTYANVSLDSGNYSYQTRASKDGTIVRSFTNGTLQVEDTVPRNGSGAVTLDAGVEVQQLASATPGQDVTISTYVNNRRSQSVPGVDVELYVDANDDGQFTNSESVATEIVTLPGGTVSTVNLTYANVSLAPGNYSYQTRASKNGTTVQSFTNGTLQIGNGSSSNNTANTMFISATDTVQASSNDTVDITYTITNPTDSSTSVLVEYPNLPANLTLQSVNGDIAQELLGSTPPGAITINIAADGNATLTATVRVAADAPAGETLPVTAEATVSASGSPQTNTTTTTVEVIAEDPLVTRFGGGDGQIDNLDILSAVNAANSGSSIGGDPVSNLDVLQLVNRANAQGSI
jgi:hypothetical protein